MFSSRTVTINDLERDTDMEAQIHQIMNEVKNEFEDYDLTTEKIIVYDYGLRVQGMIKLNCLELAAEDDELIMQSIAEKLSQIYPNEFGEGSERDSWIDVEGCSKSSGSPDGTNIYYSQTQWRIFDGTYDFKI